MLPYRMDLPDHRTRSVVHFILPEQQLRQVLRIADQLDGGPDVFFFGVEYGVPVSKSNKLGYPVWLNPCDFPPRALRVHHL